MKSHINGTLETLKFADRRPQYEEYMAKIPLLGCKMDEIIENFPAFVGKMTLNRCFTLYELYKKTLGISGHIAEIGVYKGFGSILFGKLTQIFEPESLTMVHGFDHWGGTDATTDSPLQIVGGNKANEHTVRELIQLQGLDSTVKIHNLDVVTGLDSFFERYPHLQFKLVFLDSGTYDCTSSAIKALWPRLNVGGIMIFDQNNHEVAPGESQAIRELLPNEKIETIPGSWMPNSYIIKKGNKYE
jgi:hypothetical protein